MEVVLGTHPIAQSYYEAHTALGTWKSAEWAETVALTLADENTRQAYGSRR